MSVTFQSIGSAVKSKFNTWQEQERIKREQHENIVKFNREAQAKAKAKQEAYRRINYEKQLETQASVKGKEQAKIQAQNYLNPKPKKSFFGGGTNQFMESMITTHNPTQHIESKFGVKTNTITASNTHPLNVDIDSNGNVITNGSVKKVKKYNPGWEKVKKQKLKKYIKKNMKKESLNSNDWIWKL